MPATSTLRSMKTERHRIPVTLVADTTTVFSAIAYDGLERRILQSGEFTFLITESVFDELYKLLTRKLGLSPGYALYKLRDAPLIVAGNKLFGHKMGEADRLIGFRDRSDAPTVGLALTVRNDGIWSSDRDFEVLKGRIRVWRSRELLDLARQSRSRRRGRKLKYI
jgi:predicted nucleic acid-binding protein